MSRYRLYFKLTTCIYHICINSYCSCSYAKVHGYLYGVDNRAKVRSLNETIMNTAHFRNYIILKLFLLCSIDLKHCFIHGYCTIVELLVYIYYILFFINLFKYKSHYEMLFYLLFLNVYHYYNTPDSRKRLSRHIIVYIINMSLKV